MVCSVSGSLACVLHVFFFIYFTWFLCCVHGHAEWEIIGANDKRVRVHLTGGQSVLSDWKQIQHLHVSLNLQSVTGHDFFFSTDLIHTCVCCLCLWTSYPIVFFKNMDTLNRAFILSDLCFIYDLFFTVYFKMHFILKGVLNKACVRALRPSALILHFKWMKENICSFCPDANWIK